VTKALRTVFFLVGIVAATLLINSFGVGKLIAYTEKVGWWFVAIIGVWAVVYFMNTGAWMCILSTGSSEKGKRDIGFWRTWQVCVSGFAINYVTPFVGLGGEPYRVLALKDSIGMHESLSSVILYSMLHFLSSFLFWIVTIIVVAIFFPISENVRILLGIMLLISIVSSWFIISRHVNGVFGPILFAMKRIPFLRKESSKLEEKEKSLRIVDEKITDFYLKKKKTFYMALGFEFAARVVSSFEFVCILKSIGTNISFLQSVYLNAGFSLLLNIFFFVPMELGVREGGMFLMLKTIGFTSGIGIFVAVVTRIRELFWIVIGIILIQASGYSPKRQTLPELISQDESIDGPTSLGGGEE
jgi:hypothetical protein